MSSFTETELKIIRILLDNTGHPNWDLVKRLDMKPPNVSRLLRSLEKKGVIYLKLRITTRGHELKESKNSKLMIWEISPEESEDKQTNKRRYSEHAWFIEPNLDIWESIVDALINDTEDLLVTLKIDQIKRSGYFNLMVEKYGDRAIAPIKKLEDSIQKDFWKDQNKDLWDY
jgi:DNA-binding MarR family transcriptional regulator